MPADFDHAEELIELSHRDAALYLDSAGGGEAPPSLELHSHLHAPA